MNIPNGHGEYSINLTIEQLHAFLEEDGAKFSSLTFEEYEKTVPAYVPKGGIHWLMGRVHVSTPDAEIEADIRQRLANNPNCSESMMRECVKYAIACHRENQGLYRAVVSGRF